LLLSRLDGVRRTGRGWSARCPAHDDHSASLSIAEADDGRVLIHCFAGCAAADVVAAVDLSLAHLFAEKPRASSPGGWRAARAAFREAGWRAALGVLSVEATVVESTAETILRGEPLMRDDVERIHLASIRIHDAREVLSV
jgi:hypothetical protein